MESERQSIFRHTVQVGKSCENICEFLFFRHCTHIFAIWGCFRKIYFFIKTIYFGKRFLLRPILTCGYTSNCFFLFFPHFSNIFVYFCFWGVRGALSKFCFFLELPHSALAYFQKQIDSSKIPTLLKSLVIHANPK